MDKETPLELNTNGMMTASVAARRAQAAKTEYDRNVQKNAQVVLVRIMKMIHENIRNHKIEYLFADNEYGPLVVKGLRTLGYGVTENGDMIIIRW